MIFRPTDPSFFRADSHGGHTTWLNALPGRGKHKQIRSIQVTFLLIISLILIRFLRNKDERRPLKKIHPRWYQIFPKCIEFKQKVKPRISLVKNVSSCRGFSSKEILKNNERGFYRSFYNQKTIWYFELFIDATDFYKLKSKSDCFERITYIAMTGKCCDGDIFFKFRLLWRGINLKSLGKGAV